ncbi:VCBS domain-containing protein [Devosia sp. Root105]|uniref:VCBS domain-containing protein n=1 Tax=Devosia sp. Root105 TaxID=1736423 RepID=UPI000B072DF5|nr:VCBS domain-containing protein [Devosia sp. Root105]
MAAITKGIVTSFGNTPQAVDDVFNASALGIGSSGSYAPILIDVMANDKAGGAKTLYSLDNADSLGGIRPTDLLTQDLARTEAASTDTSLNGARIWITADGQVGYDASTLSSAALAQIQGLGAGQYFTDTFTYAIRMANGTLSWATAQIKIAGTNDAATISGTSTGSTVEDTDGQLHAEGTLSVTDLDAGQNVFQAPPPASLNGTYGTFTFDALTGQWTYDLDHDKANHLYGGEEVHDTLVVTSFDGTASRTIDVTVTGTNDAADLSADVEELTEGDTAAAISTSGQLTIVR